MKLFRKTSCVVKLDSLIEMPSFDNTFDLREKDYPPFQNAVENLFVPFKNKLIDKYSYDLFKGWEKKNQSLVFERLEDCDDYSVIWFKSSQGPRPCFVFKKDYTKFAFLKKNKSRGEAKGLYISTPSEFDKRNPWANRNEAIYVVHD